MPVCQFFKSLSSIHTLLVCNYFWYCGVVSRSGRTLMGVHFRFFDHHCFVRLHYTCQKAAAYQASDSLSSCLVRKGGYIHPCTPDVTLIYVEWSHETYPSLATSNSSSESRQFLETWRCSVSPRPALEPRSCEDSNGIT